MWLKDLIGSSEDKVAYGILGSLMILVAQLAISIHSSFWLNIPYDIPMGWCAALCALFGTTITGATVSKAINKKEGTSVE